MNLKRVAQKIGKFNRTKDDVVRLLWAAGIIPVREKDRMGMKRVTESYVSKRGVKEAASVARVAIEDYLSDNPELSAVVLKMTGCLGADNKKNVKMADSLLEVMSITLVDILINTNIKPPKL